MATMFARASLTTKSALVRPDLLRDDRLLRRAEQSEREDVHLDQIRRRVSLLHFAFDNSHFYRDLYSASGITRSDLADPDVFESLPIVEKGDLRTNVDDIVVRSTRDRFGLRSTTGGSTGEPLSLLHDSRSPVAAMWWRVYRWWGIGPADDKAYIQRERRSAAGRLREALEWWPTNQIYLDARDMSHASMTEFARRAFRTQPALLNGYVGGVHEFAHFIQSTGTRWKSPTAIGVTAAPITASQRLLIESTLGAPVYDQYRSAEVPWIAAECRERNGLHVLEDLRAVEVVGDDGARSKEGVVGDVLVTDLFNRVFPLIRYRLGDRSYALAGNCSCGLPFSRLGPIQGRISDVLRLPSGKAVSGGLTGLFNARPDAVRQFQIHQEADGAIVLISVPSEVSDSHAVIESAARELRRIVENSVPVRTRYVSEIRHDGGKSRVIRSDVSR